MPSVRMNLRHFFFGEEQIVQRTERAVLLYLKDGHLLAVDGQFNEASPAIKLMGTDFANVLGIAVWTT